MYEQMFLLNPKKKFILLFYLFSLLIKNMKDGNTNLVEIIQTAVDWIHSKRLAGMNVLVQCEWGVNR